MVAFAASRRVEAMKYPAMTRSSLIWVVATALSWTMACGSPSRSLLGGDAGASVSANGGAASAGSSGKGASGGGGADLVDLETGTAGEGGSHDAVCGGTTLAASPKLVNVLLVVDKSSSMSATPTGFGDSKWNGLRAALTSALDAGSGKVAFGLDFFPSSGGPSVPLPNGCALPTSGAPTVAVSPAAPTVDAIKKALEDNSPAGATPTAAGLGRALAYYTTGAGAALKGEHYVLLATDGGPNCDDGLSCEAASCTVNMDGLCPASTNCCDPQLDPAGPGKCLDDGATVAMVKQLAQANIKTFVVGIPGTEAYGSTLESIAIEGGEPNPSAPPSYFAISAAGGVKALSEVLTNITTGLITSCELVLSEQLPALDKINVVIDGNTILEGDADGWSLDSSSTPPTIVLKGATCARVSKSGAEKLTVTFGCPTEHVK